MNKFASGKNDTKHEDKAVAMKRAAVNFINKEGHNDN